MTDSTDQADHAFADAIEEVMARYRIGTIDQGQAEREMQTIADLYLATEFPELAE